MSWLVGKRDSRGKRVTGSHYPRVGSWNIGGLKDRNGVGILVDGDLREQVVEVRRINDRLMMVKLVIGGCALSVISAYAPQWAWARRRSSYEDLDEEWGGTWLLDFAKAFELVIANSCFSKKENHRLPFVASVAKTRD
ncbi:hypothetical protein H5410_057194 [Solanum commersonii]|uniref:Uncharacterized protein n=1 Tax=Solanum commersonii TaxID=4109 RepID=A0A9J5WPF3_SOLCO|nr:hypothetical protein H5410_057194 [Solanum commersonii]